MISHKHKYIFIGTQKCGNTSIWGALLHPPVSCPRNKLYQNGVYSTYNGKKITDWPGYLIFTVVRNPWSRYVSSYHYIKTLKCNKSGGVWRDKNLSFKETLYNLPTLEESKHDYFHMTLPQSARMIDKQTGKFLPELVIRMENMQAGYNKLCDKLNVPRHHVKHANKTPGDRKHYTEYYDDETRQIVAELYAKDIEYFGYKFGE